MAILRANETSKVDDVITDTFAPIQARTVE